MVIDGKKLIVLPKFFKDHLKQYRDSDYYFHRLLQNQLGFEAVYSDRFKEIPEDAKIIMTHTTMYSRLPATDLTHAPAGIKIICFVEDLYAFPRAKEVLNNLFDRCDMILSYSYTGIKNIFPQHTGKYVRFPKYFASHKRYTDLKFNENPRMKCLLTGRVQKARYPVREFIAKHLDGYKELFDILHHPGYNMEYRGKPIKFSKRFSSFNMAGMKIMKPAIGDEYASLINKYFCSIATPTAFNALTAKHVEIPAAGCLLLAPETEDVRNAGFIAGKHYVPFEKEAVFKTVAEVLSHPEDYEGIRREGMKFVRKNHSVVNRYKLFTGLLTSLFGKYEGVDERRAYWGDDDTTPAHLRGKMMNRGGDPHLNPAAMALLRKAVKRDMTVLEMGAGSSTIWFAERVKQIISFESDKDWFKAVQASLARKGLTSAELIFSTDYPEAGIPEQNQQFDIIFIDGRGRVKSVESSYKYLKPGGLLIFDDAHRREYNRAKSLLDGLGWKRTDTWHPFGRWGAMFWRKP